jgi:dihydroorotase-like cyclic amidohydrolase
MSDILIHGQNLALAITDGQITAAAPTLTGSARQEIDACHALILPGWIDCATTIRLTP